jgi:hypothetical protein
LTTIARRRPKRAKTSTIEQAMRILAADIHSEDGTANAAILEAAERLAEMRTLLTMASGDWSIERWPTHFRRKVRLATT